MKFGFKVKIKAFRQMPKNVFKKVRTFIPPCFGDNGDKGGRTMKEAVRQHFRWELSTNRTKEDEEAMRNTLVPHFQYLLFIKRAAKEDRTNQMTNDKAKLSKYQHCVMSLSE